MISSDIATRMGNYGINEWAKEDAAMFLQAFKEAGMPIPFTKEDVENAFIVAVNKANDKPDRSERFESLTEFRLIALKLVGLDFQKMADTFPTRRQREWTKVRADVLTQLFSPPASLQPKPRRSGGFFAGLRW